MARQFFSGNSIEQAVMAAARHYQIEPERLAYTHRDKKHGFLNQRRRIVIEVDPDNLEKGDEVAEPEIDAAQTTPSAATGQRGETAEEDRRARLSRAGRSDDDEDLDDDLGDDDLEDDDSDEEDQDDDGFESDDDDPDDDDPDDDDSDDDDSDDDDPEDDDSDEDDFDEDDRRSPSGGRGGRGRGGRGRARRGDDRVGQGRRDVKIEKFAWNKNEDGPESEDLESGEGRELSAVESCVERILDVMDLEIEYTITEGETMELEFSGEDAEFLIEDNGKVLKAVEHIVPRMVRGLIGHSVSINADCEGFRADHEKTLRKMAEDAAEEVVDQDRPKTLSPMNPADRRIVHLALVDHPDVETVSQGHGFMKRVKILPAGS